MYFDKRVEDFLSILKSGKFFLFIPVGTVTIKTLAFSKIFSSLDIIAEVFFNFFFLPLLFHHNFV